MKVLTAFVPLGNATDAASCGGKAANLARLIAAGAPVPDGIVIPNGAIEGDGIDIEELLPFLSAPVIVRSSAIGEDSADASFAGQLESVADVTDGALLRAAIALVWASQQSARVLAYQTARGKSLAGMGIIVQRQVEAVISGVLFTVSPTDARQMLVEYCGGMGEALVSGAVNPGRIAITRPAELSVGLSAEASAKVGALAKVEAGLYGGRSSPLQMNRPPASVFFSTTSGSEPSRTSRSTSRPPSAARRTSNGRSTVTESCGSSSHGRLPRCLLQTCGRKEPQP